MKTTLLRLLFIALISLGCLFLISRDHVYGTRRVRVNISSYEDSYGNNEEEWKTILFWTNFFGSVWGVSFHYASPEELKAAGCPSWRCTFTHNRTDIEKADAVVFSSVEMTLEDAPQYRTPSQRWVWVTLEAPRGVTGVHDLDVIRRENLHHLINWTMTYNRYADVIGSYGHFRSKGKMPLPLRPNLSSSYPGVIRKYLDSLRKNMTLADVMGPAWREFVNRPKLVSWVVSHCPTISKREQYVDELVKYAPVDIYGRCGNLDCLPKNPFHECWNHTMGRLYLFYLALENDLCDDYITEKLYRALYYKLVPVVWGGNGYEDVMVPGSYINARHYHPKDLAKLLLDLQEDPVAYGRYHLWRGFWDLKLGGSMCELCHKLHTDKEPKHYTDIPAWRLKSNRCFQVPNNLFMDPENPDAWKEVISSNKAS